MKASLVMVHAAAIILCLAATGCVPVAAKPSNVIGTLRVSGPNVRLNNAPGRDGEAVLIGSTVTTGPGSSALVEFRGGGYLQLDQNTDPFFEWLEQSKCILIRMLKGQAYLKRERACVEGPNISLVLNSEANLFIQNEPAVTEVTLFKGKADITLPAQVTLLPGQQFVASGQRIAALRALSPAELGRVAAWRRNFRFTREMPVDVLYGPETRQPVPGRRPHMPHPTGDTGTRGSGSTGSTGATGSGSTDTSTPPSGSGSGAGGTIPKVRRTIPSGVIKSPEPVIR